RREDQRKVPLEAILDVRRAPAHRIVWIRIDIAHLAGAMIVTSNQTVVRSGENNFRIFRQRSNPAGLAAANIVPIAESDCTFIGSASNAHRRVVLLRAVDVIRKIIVERDAIKLSCRLILLAPTLAAVE